MTLNILNFYIEHNLGEKEFEKLILPFLEEGLKKSKVLRLSLLPLFIVNFYEEYQQIQKPLIFLFVKNFLVL